VNVVYDLYEDGVPVKQLTIKENTNMTGVIGLRTTASIAPFSGTEWAGYDFWTNGAKVVTTAETYCTGSTSCSVTMPSVSTYNLVVASGSCTGLVVGFTDNGGLTFTNDASPTLPTVQVDVAHSYSAVSGGSLTVTLNCNSSGPIGIELEDVSGIVSPTVSTGVGVCTTSCTSNMATSRVAFSPGSGDNYFAIGVAYAKPGSSTSTPGTGFAFDGNQKTDSPCDPLCNPLQVAEYSTAVSSPTTFIMTDGATPTQWVEGGVVFVSTGTPNPAPSDEAFSQFYVPSISDPPTGCPLLGVCEIAPWVGLSPYPGGGGANCPNGCIAQTGIDSEVDVLGIVTNDGWYEFLPSNPVWSCFWGYLVNAGDNIVAEAYYSSSSNTYITTLYDATQAISCQGTSSPGQVPGGQPYYNQLIAEKRSGNPLAEFSTLTFWNNGEYSSYTQNLYSQWIIQNSCNGNNYVNVNVGAETSSNSGSFSITWNNSDCS
jgi:hypothetical protein